MVSYNCVFMVLVTGIVAMMGLGRTTTTTYSSNSVRESTEPMETITISEVLSTSGGTNVASSKNSTKEPINISTGLSSSGSTVVAASTNASKAQMLLECKCKSLLNKYEKGNCTTKSWSKSWRGGKRWCYVEQPSDCKDLENSTVIEGEEYSAKACPSTGLLIYLFMGIHVYII